MIVEYKREFLLIKKEVKCGNEIYIIIVAVSYTHLTLPTILRV